MYSGTYNRSLYLFRLWLQFKEVRNLQKIKSYTVKVAGEALALARLGVVATFYTAK